MVAREYNFRPAVLEDVGLFIGLAGGTGSGKTMSAMAMATGIVPPGERFAVIDTENRRARHYADDFKFDVLDLAPPFNPASYGEAVQTAFDLGYKAIVVDSASHEHDGIGGYLDMQAEDLATRVERAMKKKPDLREWDAIEKLTPLSWAAPRKERKRMMNVALNCSTSIPIIWCFRAEEKVFTSKDGKLVANNPPIWAPLCGKGMPFEMTVFFMLHRERPGVPEPIKLGVKHRHLFALDKPLTEESGRRIAEWARGAKKSAPQGSPTTGQPNTTLGGSAPSPSSPAAAGPITESQVADLKALCQEKGVALAALLEKAGVGALEEIAAERYAGAVRWVTNQQRAA